MLERLRAAWHAFCNYDQEPDHRYEIRIGEAGFYADEYKVDPYDGSVSWFYEGLDGQIVGRKMDGWVVKDFEPGASREQFRNIETIEKTESI